MFVLLDVHCIHAMVHTHMYIQINMWICTPAARGAGNMG